MPYLKNKGNKMRRLLLLIASALAALTFTGCWFQTDANIASHNLSKAADMFEINRRIVFYNGINGEYILEINGRCSIKDQTNQLEVTCKTGPNSYKKHFLGLSDNVTYFAEQLESKDVNVYHYKVIFKPQTILPDVDFREDTKALKKAIIPDNKDN